MKIVLAISGSSGSIYAKVMMDQLMTVSNIDVALVYSENALENWKIENPETEITSYPFTVYKKNEYRAPFASGSANWDAMIVCPCSAGFMGRVANGISNDLMTRAADVMLKERKKLILVLRETPFNLIHIENMKKITLSGGIICPAIPSFYSTPKNMDALASTVTSRALSLAGVEVASYKWGQD